MSLNLNKSHEELREDEDAARGDYQKYQKKADVVLLLGAGALCLLLLTVFVFLGVNAYQNYQAHLELTPDGPQSDAFLENEYTEVTRRGAKSYRVSYYFTVDGQLFRGKSELGLMPPRRVRVLYVAANPNINKIVGGVNEYEYSTVPLLTKLFVLLLLFALVAGSFAWRIYYPKLDQT